MNGDDKPIALPVPGNTVAEPIRSTVTLLHDQVDAAAAWRRQQQDRETMERAAREAAEVERRAIAVYDADARRRRGDGNVGFGQGLVTVGAATAIGLAIGGPIAALLGGGAGWVIDRVIQGR